jgi:Family of unknown function (DUF6353)
MFNPSQLFKSGMDQMTEHMPAILTAFGVVGTVGTAVLAGKASFEAADILREAEQAESQDLTGQPDNEIEIPKFEKVKLVWLCYLPAATLGTASVAAIIMSHRISSKRAAVLAAAYALNQDKLEEYQDKVKEKLGVKKEKDIRTELNQDKINRDYDGNELMFNDDDNDVIIREDYTGRFFKGQIEHINHAVNEINHRIMMEGSARMSDFYDLIQISHVSTSDHFGWTTNERLEIDWSTCTTPDKTKAVHCFDYVHPPVMNPEASANFR